MITDILEHYTTNRFCASGNLLRREYSIKLSFSRTNLINQRHRRLGSSTLYIVSNILET